MQNLIFQQLTARRCFIINLIANALPSLFTLLVFVLFGTAKIGTGAAGLLGVIIIPIISFLLFGLSICVFVYTLIKLLTTPYKPLLILVLWQALLLVCTIAISAGYTLHVSFISLEMLVSIGYLALIIYEIAMLIWLNIQLRRSTA